MGVIVMPRLETLEWSTILLHLREVSPKRATPARLKFAFNRMSWTNEVSASAFAKRERRLAAMIRRALQCFPRETYVVRLALFDWNAQQVSLAHGSMAKEFLARAAVWRGADTPENLRPLKEWVIAELQRDGCW